MLKSISISPVVRAVFVIGAVAALVTSVTFATLQDTATLTDNTIASATPDLNIANFEEEVCGDFDVTAVGFAFTGAIPGGDPVPDPANKFCLENAGEVDFNVYASIPTEPTEQNVDLSLVDVILSCADTNGTFAVTESIADLAAAHPNGVLMAGGSFVAGEEAVCDAQVQMHPGAVSGDSGTVNQFDLEFRGVNALEDTL